MEKRPPLEELIPLETCREALGFAIGFLPLLRKEFGKGAKA